MSTIGTSQNLGLLAAQLQCKLDDHHMGKLSQLQQKSKRWNEELRAIIYPIMHEIKMLKNTPDSKGQTFDFSRFESQIQHLEQIYKDYQNEFTSHFPGEGKALEDKKGQDLITNLENLIFPENIEEIKYEELEVILAKLNELEKHHNDGLQQIANDLLITMNLNHIISKINERALENHGASMRYIIQNHR